MSFTSQAYFASLSDDKQRSLASAHTIVGWHPETRDNLLIPHNDRYAGTYVLGVQGSGKSALLQNLITADMQNGHAVIVIDPHGDLIGHCIGQVPPDRMQDIFLLDMEDEGFPFGCNIFSVGKLQNNLDVARAVERLMHMFEVQWPEVMSQQNLPRYLRAAAIAFLANYGMTLVDMYAFLQDQSYRARLLANVADPSVRNFWHTQYDTLGPHEQYRRVQPLIARLEALFMGRSLVRNIVGQRQNTISFRNVMQSKKIVFIKLPTKTIPGDARLIGTILLSQIQNALFSFGDVPQDKRPGVSLYVDEFAHFATSDFNELLTEGRKFGMRVTVAHQYRSRLPNFLQASTMTARTTVCFRLTPEDGREMAHLYPSNEATVQRDDIELHPVHYLLTHPSNDPIVKLFTDLYLHPLQGHKRGAGRVEIEMRGAAPSPFEVLQGGRFDNPRVTDPTHRLDNLLHEVMREGNANLPIPPEIVIGFSNCGRGFFKQARGIRHDDPLLQADAKFPRHLVVPAADGFRWTRRPEGGTEQLLHFVFHLRLVMQRLAEKPIGKATAATPTEVAKMLTSLPKRAAFVRSGDTVGVIYTHDIPPLQRAEIADRTKYIIEHTRQVYCHPRDEVERLFMQSPAQPVAAVQPVSRWEEIEP